MSPSGSEAAAPVATGGDPVAAGLRFLAERQLASGAFPVRRGFDLAAGQTEADDHALFATAMVAQSLAACEEPAAEAIRRRAARHLAEHMEPGGVWRHWGRGHPQYHWLPADLDDTATIAGVLRAAGIPVPGNAGVLLANRDPRGLFYTWLVPRWPPPPHAGFWRVAARRLRRPVLARRFWRTSAAPGDVDGVVNANILAYLGDGPHAGPVVDYLHEVVRRGGEDRCDKWYRSPFMLHYALGRCTRAGVGGLDRLGEVVRGRVLAAAGEDGRIARGALDTALALGAVAGWEELGPVGERARRYLAGTQSAGSWPAEPVYHGGPPGDHRVPCWGSEELTTGLCVEALARGGR